MASAMASPSLVLVPRPSSSMIAILWLSTFLSLKLTHRLISPSRVGITHLKMKAISRISNEKLDRFDSMLSSVVTLAKILSTIPKAA